MDAAAQYVAAVKEAQLRDFSSTQLDLPAELATMVRSIGRDIKSEDLVQLEHVPHITLKYGLHTNDPQPVRAILAAEAPISVKFGRTEVLSGGDDDALVIKIFSPDLRRINARFKRLLPHTETYPQYQPHATVAYVRKGRGKKYVGRGDLEGRTQTFNEVRFSSRSGRRTMISLQTSKAAEVQADTSMFDNQRPWKENVPLWLAAGGLGGAGLGRYFVAPVLSRLLKLDPKRARRVFTLLGMGIGMTPGMVLGGTRKKLKGKFFAPGGPPQTEDERSRYLHYSLGSARGIPDSNLRTPGGNFSWPGQVEQSMVKMQGVDPAVYDRALWDPTFPVSQSLDDIARNPAIPPLQRAKMKMLVAEAGRQQGVGLTGLASPGALMAALPRVARHALPTAGGAWAAAQLLGAPRRLKQTAIGGALLYSVLKGFMEKAGVATPPGYKLRTSDSARMRNYYADTEDGQWAGSVRARRGADGKITVGSLRVGKPHRGKGLARYLMAVLDNEHKGQLLQLEPDAFADRPHGNDELTGFYASLGYKATGDGAKMNKTARMRASA